MVRATHGNACKMQISQRLVPTAYYIILYYIIRIGTCVFFLFKKCIDITLERDDYAILAYKSARVSITRRGNKNNSSCRKFELSRLIIAIAIHGATRLRRIYTEWRIRTDDHLCIYKVGGYTELLWRSVNCVFLFKTVTLLEFL